MTKKPVQSSVVYHSEIQTKYGLINIVLDIDILKKKLSTWISHLRIHRHINTLSEDRAAQKSMQRTYEKDYVVAAYIAQGVDYHNAVDYAIKTYKQMDEEAQVAALSILLVDDMFRITILEDKNGRKGVVLREGIEYFDIDPKHFSSPSNEVREELGDPILPPFSSSSILEQKSAYLATLLELDKEFATELQRVLPIALEKMNERLGESDTDEDGFHS